jgi:hypothetical protein
LLDRSLRHPLEDDVDGQTDALLSSVLTGVTSLSAAITFRRLPALARWPSEDVDVAPVEHSEAMPLDSAESKLLFSDDGVRTGDLRSEWTVRLDVMMASVLGGTLLTPENRFDVRMSMSACVISSSMQR